MNKSKYLQQFTLSKVRPSGACGWVVFLLLLWGSSSPPIARAALLTFDDLTPTPNMPIPSGYGGLQWNNFWVVNVAITYPPNSSGYFAGMTSPPNVAYNGGGLPAELSNANPFDVYSGHFTAAWND